MKYNISCKAIKAYNQKLEPSGNEHITKARGYSSLDEWCFLNMVKHHLFGVMKPNRNITRKDINNFYPYYESERELAKKFEVQQWNIQS